MQQPARQQHNDGYMDRVFYVQARVIGEEKMDLYFCFCWGIITLTVATIYLVIAEQNEYYRTRWWWWRVHGMWSWWR